MNNLLKQFIPRPIRSTIRKIYYLILDTSDFLFAQKDELIPPRRKTFVGDGDFKKIGENFLRYFIELGALKPNDRVLDVGCGIGRMAIPLTKYLNQMGSYEGFDIIPDEINWCKENISTKYPNFHFQLADIFNKNYNPKGKLNANGYKFPYEDESFDFVFLTSVFTHMLPKDVDHYLSEIARVIKRNKRCLLTFFLLNKESYKLINIKKSSLNFKYEFGNYKTIDPNIPEIAISYDESFIIDLIKKNGLKIIKPIYYGSWCGREDFLSFQDIIIVSKE
ncbi:MAG: class I SAM-dependent methyltransferase [Deltaproteobacteria bacterium]|nr:class I SAM-dependent methyltransferase [Deltaproteobacteria bacterium]